MSEPTKPDKLARLLEAADDTATYIEQVEAMIHSCTRLGAGENDARDDCGACQAMDRLRQAAGEVRGAGYVERAKVERLARAAYHGPVCAERRREREDWVCSCGLSAALADVGEESR